MIHDVRYVLGLLVACSADPRSPTINPARVVIGDADAGPAKAPDTDPTAGRRCQAYGNDTTACSRDRACVPYGPVPLCDHCLGGPMACGSCLEWAALNGTPPEYCALRAAGNDRAACELRFHRHPQRCAGLENDAGTP